jgi:hypothetical protein
MQKQNRLTKFLAEDRQWPRRHRLRFAKRMVNLSIFKKDQTEIDFWKEVVKRNAYDAEDRIWEAGLSPL